ncbi:hypothetical protein [Roseateles sp. BYS78W]|uniref:hypothetical protein n=1 Tax=Pelomonas candidula TaxID=3299025 RepID=UPI00374A84C8
MQQQLSLLPVTEYAYPADSPLMKRMPLATASEVRSSAFPASNNVVVPGKRGVPTAAQAPYEFRDDDGGLVRMWGPRRERHRRFLDYILFIAKPVAIAGGNQGFFIDRKDAARCVFGDKQMYLHIDKLAVEMQHIQVQYVPPGFNDGVGQVQPLCVDYMSDYRFGVDSAKDGLDAALTLKGYDARQFEGLAFVALGGVYLRRFLSDISLRYHPALETIYQMDVVAASLARFALSNDYLRGRPLNDVLDLLGASSGSARDRTVAELKHGKDAELLAELGIAIRLHNGRNCVFYETARDDVKVIKSRGLHGVASSRRSLDKA